MSLPEGQICIKKRAGTESNLLFFPALTRKEFRYVRIFQRISIGVRIAIRCFHLHSEQVVSISASMDFVEREIEVEPLDTFYVCLN